MCTVEKVVIPSRVECEEWKAVGCQDCGHSTGIANPEAFKNEGKPCWSCGKPMEYFEKVYHNRFPREVYYKVKCKCRRTVEVRYDGKECVCGQMYNAVGQPITHLGYDSFGDINEYWDGE